MAKLIWLLLLATLACRLLFQRWPWEFLGGRKPSAEEVRARALLGLHKNATREEIIDAHRRLVVRVHPDRGGLAEQVHEANAARDVLLSRLANKQKEPK
jgi:hypothetical protein